jgi:dipeptidase
VCDTLVALRGWTREGATIFAKNSDRDPNEAQVLEFHPRSRRTEERVKCTYVSVEQVDETYAVLISRPYWMWGAEMGVNEHGVAIGNEAVWTREPYAEKGLTGMDLVRLALERSRTASEAVKWITSLLEQYGQGGNCSAARKLLYHNSFIIADPREAWVLETAGRYWVAERVKDVRSISNALSIGDSWDLASSGVIEHARERGYCRGRFSFRDCYSDRLYTRVAKGRERQAYTQRALEEAKGAIDFRFAASLLRSHAREPYDPSRGSNADVCMHAGGFTRPSQTAASMIAILYEEAPLVFATGTSTPCISAFKPLFPTAGLPDLGPQPGGVWDGGRSYWWRHELLSRRLACSYSRYAPAIRRDMIELEERYYARAVEARERLLRGEASPEELRRLTREAFEEAARLEERWLAAVKPSPCLNPLYALFWRRVNRAARIPA